MKTITLSTLREILASVKGTTAVSMVTVTDARCRKTGNPYAPLGPIVKVCRVNGMVGADHEASVERQQVREGGEPTYRAGDRSWGERLSAALVKRDGDYYLPIQLNPTVKVRPIYLAPVIRGTRPHLALVAKETIAALLPADRREQDAAHQGVERPVVRRDYKLSSLCTLSINGERYRVRT